MALKASRAVRLSVVAVAVAAGAWRVVRRLNAAAAEEAPVREPSMFWSLDQRRDG